MPQPDDIAQEEKNTKFNIRAAFWFVIVSTIFIGVILNFNETIEPVWPWQAGEVEAVKIPHLSVKLSNDGDKTISLPVKGDLWLWPPGDQSWDLEGAYELKDQDNKAIYSHAITVPARDEKTFIIQLIRARSIHQDTAALKRIFRAGGWEIQLIFVTDQHGRSILYSPRIPFTEKGMAAAYTVDIFR
ncbi:MAG: hypothetical protein QNK29_11350 [Desulfobacterales bacterium]|nr:hypothetical protein [Desulfobacterales bacterium]